MRRRRLPILLLALATTAATVTGVPGAAQALPAKTLQQPSGKPTTVTLITGDRVTVRGDGSLAVTAGAGRAGTRFLSQKIKDHQYVYPADALALLRAGRVDQRLFDVTELIGFGYTDKAADLPLLVAYPKADKAKKGAAARSAALSV